MKILFAVAPGYGLMLSVVPLMWAPRAAGNEILVANGAGRDDLPEGYRLAKKDRNPFGLFTLTMTEGTIADEPDQRGAVRCFPSGLCAARRGLGCVSPWAPPARRR